MPETWDETDGYDVAMISLLCGMLALAPLALGSVAVWARGVLFACSLVLVALWLVQAAQHGTLRVVRTPIWIFIVAFFALALFQLVPFSSGLLKLLSPGTWSTYGRTLMGYPKNYGARTISLSPYITWGEIMRYFILAAVFTVVINTFRRRWQVVALILTLIGVGTFEALYGFGEQFSGNQHIFWIPRTRHAAAVAGTYINKNHFAGLLEMIVPVCLGLLFGISAGGSGRRSAATGSRSLSVRVSRLLSNSRIYQQLALAGLAIIMFVAIFFSLSRAGTIAAVVSMVGFMVAVGLTAGFRRYTILMILLVGAIVLISSGIGMQLVVERMEKAFGEQSTSWYGRMDMARSALPYIADYPVLGSGLGTFRDVFPRYQSGRFGEQYAPNLHNDWMQLFCEVGFVGAIIVIAGFLAYVWSTLKVTFKRRVPFSRWIGAGCLLGILAMVIHSFADANLSAITSNGMVFAALLGIGYVASRMPGRRKGSRSRLEYWNISIQAVPLRICVIGAAIILAISPLLVPGSDIQADIYFNKYLALTDNLERPHLLLWDHYEKQEDDKSRQSEDKDDDSNEAIRRMARQYLKWARQEDPENPGQLYWSGLQSLEDADAKVRRRALERTRAFLGRRAETESPQMFRKVVQTFSANLRPRMLSDLEEELKRAGEYFRHAVNNNPTRGVYHVRLGEVQRELAPNTESGTWEARTGLWLAPHKPWVLYRVGRLLFLSAVRGTGNDNAELLEEVEQCWRRAVRAVPAYTDKIYPIIKATNRYEMLVSVTPPTTRAYQRLCETLWDAQRWDDLLKALDQQEDLAEAKLAASGAPSTSKQTGMLAAPKTGGSGMDRRTPQEILVWVAQRRAMVQSRRGRYRARETALRRYQKLLASESSVYVEEAEKLRRQGRASDALRLYIEALHKDWSNPELRLAVAEVASLPGVSGAVPPWQRALDQLYKLVIYNKELSPDRYAKLVDVLDTLPLGGKTEELLAKLVEAAGAVRAGDPAEARDMLESLSLRDDATINTWRQKHLIWFYLGLAYDQLGMSEEAAGAYQRVLEIVPTHRSSLVHLKQLGHNVQDRLEQLTPEVMCRIKFGGKTTLLGYDLVHQRSGTAKEGDDSAVEDMYVRLYWKMVDRMHRSYRPILTLVDQYGQRMSRRGLRFMDEEGRDVYPIQSARSGEVIVMKVPVAVNVDAVDLVRMRVYTPLSLEYLARSLYTDTGNKSVTFPLEM